MLLRLISHLTTTVTLSIQMMACLIIILVSIAKYILATARHKKAFIENVSSGNIFIALLLI